MLTVEAKVQRTTYKQDWANYNRAQVSEHRHFQTLLSDLCQTIPVPEAKRGNQAINPRDAAFSAILKVRSTLSARRFVGELEGCLDEGYISQIPHFNSVLKFLETEAATPILSDFVAKSAAPLVGVEEDFAVDSTGFAGARYLRWFDEKYGQPRSEVNWVKVHAIVGVKTNIVASATVLKKNSPDNHQLPGLVKAASEQFSIREVSADCAYASQQNFNAVESLGASFYPAFRKTTTGSIGGTFAKTFHYMQANRDEYAKHYHKRSNVESTFSAIKRKFGEDLRSKTELAMKNETLAKIVCHNICCVISAMYELGINPFPTCTPNDEPAHVIRFPGA